MPTFLDKNLTALQKSDPGLAKALGQVPDKGVELAQREDGSWDLFLLNSPTQKTPYYAKETLKQSCESLLAKQFKNPRVLIFLGMGLGHHILEYLRRPHALTQRIIVIEPFAPVFKKALEASDLSPMIQSPTVHFFVGSDKQSLSVFLGHLFSDNRILSLANALEYHVLEDAQFLTPQFFSEIPALVSQSIAHQFNRQFGDPFDAFIGTRNFIRNLNRLEKTPAIDEAKDLFKGKPGIVIASGPSLTASLPYLKGIGDAAVMAACPSALPAVLDQGIAPHIWLNIERLENQGAFLERLKHKPPHVFVGPLLVHPRCFEGNGGTNAFILGNTLQSNWLATDYPAVDLGHSSAHAAFIILERLGCNPIYLVGQDLCYDEHLSHAPGTWDESQNMIRQVDQSAQKFFEVPGNSGQKVKVNIFWHTYLKTFAERIIPQFKGEVYNVIPASMGACIPGTKRVDPQELTARLKDSFPVLDPLLKKLSRPAPRPWVKDIPERLARVRRMLKRLSEDASKMALQCKEFQFNETVIGGDWLKARPVYEDFMKKVMDYSSRYRLRKDLEDERGDYEHFFHSLVQGLFLQYRIEYFGRSGEEAGDLKEIKRKAEILFHMAKDEAFWANALDGLISELS